MAKRSRMVSVDKTERLAQISAVIAAKCAEAVKYRASSGLESLWMQWEDAYVGIDDTSRNDASGTKWSKPTSMQGRVKTSQKTPQDSIKSDVYIRLTSRYVDTGAAKVSEMLLGVDAKAFSVGPTPDPELIKHIPEKKKIVAAPVEGQPAQPQPEPPSADQLKDDIVRKALEHAQDAAGKAETRIYDWMVESNYPAEVRKVMHDAGRIGVGVLKGPFPDISKSQAILKSRMGMELRIVEETVPVVRWVDPWNFYPDPACGENIHDGDYVFESDFLSPRALKELAEKTAIGYRPEQIKKVLEEGPDKCNIEKANGNPHQDADEKKLFRVWYFYGSITQDDLEILNPNLDPEEDKGKDPYVIVTMVNDTIIRAVLSPFDSGRFPYNAMPWSRRAGSWAGVGIAEQVSVPQRMLNSAMRRLLENAGMASAPQFIIDQLAVIPGDQNWNFTPGKFWFKTAESPSDDVRKVFAAVTFPDMSAPLTNIIDMAFKLAEESSNIPLVSQGQPDNVPRTMGEAVIVNTNAHTLLRSIAYLFDDNITEPLIHAYYEWLLLDPNVPDEEKGDFKISARGSISMVERAIQEQVLQSVGEMSLNPAFGVDPKKWFAEMLRGKGLDPRKVQYTEDEQDKMASAPPQPPIQLQVVQAKAQADMQLQQAKMQGEMQMAAAEAQQGQAESGAPSPHMASAQSRVITEQIKADTTLKVQESRASAENARAESEMEIARQNGEFRVQELQLRREIALLEYSTQQQINLENAKAQLAKSAMDNQTKRQLGEAEIQLAQSENASDRALDSDKHQVSLIRDEMSLPNTP